jgi:hypothetical protein
MTTIGTNQPTNQQTYYKKRENYNFHQLTWVIIWITCLTIYTSYSRWLFIGVLSKATTSNKGRTVRRHDKHNLPLSGYILTLETYILNRSSKQKHSSLYPWNTTGWIRNYGTFHKQV